MSQTVLKYKAKTFLRVVVVGVTLRRCDLLERAASFTSFSAGVFSNIKMAAETTSFVVQTSSLFVNAQSRYRTLKLFNSHVPLLYFFVMEFLFLDLTANDDY